MKPELVKKAVDLNIKIVGLKKIERSNFKLFTIGIYHDGFSSFHGVDINDILKELELKCSKYFQQELKIKIDKLQNELDNL